MSSLDLRGLQWNLRWSAWPCWCLAACPLPLPQQPKKQQEKYGKKTKNFWIVGDVISFHVHACVMFFYRLADFRRKSNSQADMAPQLFVKQLDSMYLLELVGHILHSGVSIVLKIAEALPTIFNSYPSDDSKSVLKVRAQRTMTSDITRKNTQSLKPKVDGL